jgi:phosphatidate cytidylyltransferase
MSPSETGTRIAFGALGIPVVLGAAWMGGWVLALLLAAVAGLAARELFLLALRKGSRPLLVLGTAGAAGFVLAGAFFPERGPLGPLYASVLPLLLLAALSLVIWRRGIDGDPLRSAAITVFGAAYTGGLLAFALFLRHLPGVELAWHGTALVFAPVLLTWVSDSCAYFTGRRFGRRKLIPSVSPGKTVEGAIGGVLGTLVAAVLYARLLNDIPGIELPLYLAVAFGLLVTVTGQLGDLAESLLKRDAGVKDSGTFLPGHGGALDRVDSLLFTLPVAYAFLMLLARSPA